MIIPVGDVKTTVSINHDAERKVQPGGAVTDAVRGGIRLTKNRRLPWALTEVANSSANPPI